MSEPSAHSPWPPPPPIAHIELKALLLLAVTGALLGGFLLYVMYARGAFESMQHLTLVADDSEGAMVGMEMSFSGFPVGRVRRIELGPDGKARLLIDIPVKDARWLRHSSVFTLERNLLGVSKLRAHTGMQDDAPLPDRVERPLLTGDAGNEIPRMLASLRALLDNLEAMSSADSKLNRSLDHLHTVSARMAGRHGALAGLLGSERHAQKILDALDRSNRLLENADRQLFGAQGLTESTQANLKQLHGALTDARAQLKKVDAILDDTQAVGRNLHGASADLGALRNEVEASVREIGLLLNELNRRWPFAKDATVKLP
ncbi:MAG TPA: mammalian cell entry protein [Rhodocyclaceae bacterium]|nr:mammalian cell entry protein [Rhodocyclaceae bacterium]